MPTTRARNFCDIQPTTSLALLRIQLIIPPMIPGRASAALIPNFPSSDAKASTYYNRVKNTMTSDTEQLIGYGLRLVID